MFDEHPSLCELWPKLLFSLTEELSPNACQSHILAKLAVINRTQAVMRANELRLL